MIASKSIIDKQNVYLKIHGSIKKSVSGTQQCGNMYYTLLSRLEFDFCLFQVERSSTILAEISSNVGPPSSSPKTQPQTPTGTFSPCHPTTSGVVSGTLSACRPKNGITNHAVGSLAAASGTLSAYRPKNTKAQPVNPRFLQVTDQIRRGYKVLVILRGLPGSGKSYLARKIVEVSIGSNDYHNFIFSADDYFMRRGTYQV